MDRNFDRSLTAVLKHEGGYVNNPKDPGGPTNLGVTLANFRRFVKPDGTIADLKALTIEQAAVVFRREYWDEVMASDLPDGIDLVVFDFAVNSGPSRAAKLLQRLVGVSQDGKIGPKTIKAASATSPTKLISDYSAARQEFLEGLGTFSTFGKGWTTRVRETKALALEFAAQTPEAATVKVEHVKVDKPVAVAPKGADKRGGLWGWGTVGIGSTLTSIASGFTDLPIGWKVGIGVLTLASIAFLLWKGELIVRRVKSIVAEIGQ